MKTLGVAVAALLTLSFIFAPLAEARGRTSSIRVGGYTSHGKGSHYVGGYIRSGTAIKYR